MNNLDLVRTFLFHISYQADLSSNLYFIESFLYLGMASAIISFCLYGIDHKQCDQEKIAKCL